MHKKEPPQFSQKARSARLKKSKKVTLREKDFVLPEFETIFPEFDILFNGKRVGYIQTGHAALFGIQGKDIFFRHALPKYEKFHEKIFREGRFEEYKSKIIDWIGLNSKRRDFIDFIIGLKNPVHIQFWRIPFVAARFIEHGGYTLCQPSIRELEAAGLKKKATKSEIIAFLKRMNYDSRFDEAKPLFVLTKPTKLSVVRKRIN